jgi:hypothetical protein
LKWSAPAFTVDGKILLILAAFKAHAAIKKRHWKYENC